MRGTIQKAAEKARNLASSLDGLGMRPCVFSGLDLMVSLSNHGRFSPVPAHIFTPLSAGNPPSNAAPLRVA
jgi:hypothetical protein